MNQLDGISPTSPKKKLHTIRSKERSSQNDSSSVIRQTSGIYMDSYKGDEPVRSLSYKENIDVKSHSRTKSGRSNQSLTSRIKPSAAQSDLKFRIRTKKEGHRQLNIVSLLSLDMSKRDPIEKARANIKQDIKRKIPKLSKVNQSLQHKVLSTNASEPDFNRQQNLLSRSNSHYFNY